MARADEIVRDTLKDNRASYDFLTLLSTNMFYELSNMVLTASKFPLLSCQKVAHSGSPWALGADGDQYNRVLVQIDLYALKNDQKTVSAVKYYSTHLLKKIATDAFNCLRDNIYSTSGVNRYTELSDNPMPISELNGMPVVRRSLEVELMLKNAE